MTHDQESDALVAVEVTVEFDEENLALGWLLQKMPG